MDIMKKVRTACPLVHHITNTVTINDCANATLAIGASPAMVPSVEEAPELAALASALVLNIGTATVPEIEGMLAAGKVAKKRGIPIVFDPVGVGAMPYRQMTVRRILEEIGPTVIKGNAAEMSFLAGLKSEQRGRRLPRAGQGRRGPRGGEALVLHRRGHGRDRPRLGREKSLVRPGRERDAEPGLRHRVHERLGPSRPRRGLG